MCYTSPVITPFVVFQISFAWKTFMLTILQDVACYNYIRKQFNFSRGSINSFFLVLPVAPLKILIQSY